MYTEAQTWGKPPDLTLNPQEQYQVSYSTLDSYDSRGTRDLTCAFNLRFQPHFVL